MNSLEALDNLVHCKSELKCKTCKHKSRCTMERDYNTIKQGLERLEHLEKEYKLLDETMEADDRIICQLSEEKEQLEKENQELKEQLKLSNESQETVINTMNLVSQENEKLKKAIEILKYKPFVLEFGLASFEWDESVQGYVYEYEDTEYDIDGELRYSITFSVLTKEEYELLKEVLGE